MKAFYFATALCVFGCGASRLGDDFGVRTRSAYDAQIAHKGGAPDPQTANDAKRVLAVHHARQPGVATSGAAPAPSGMTMPYGGTSAPSAGIGATGNPNPIRIEAK